jgi:hypothetical protein
MPYWSELPLLEDRGAMKKLINSLIVLALGPGILSFAQSTGSVTQTVSKRNTIGSLSATPSGNIAAGTSVSFTLILNTAGAPAPVTETVQFYDGTNSLGSPQSISLAAASNLVPYSQVNTAHGWTTTGTAPTITPLSANGPDGSTNSATVLSFPDGTSTILYAVPSATNYATLQMTFSVWAQSAVPTTLNLAITDSPQVNASQSAPCAVTSAWQRCSLVYTFPANSSTGFAVSLASASFGTPISVWGAQFEQAPAAGPYVATIGTARPTGAQAGTAAFTYSSFLAGSHSITAQYPGDTNFVGSTSNAIALTSALATPAITLTDSPSATSVYGATITLTAQVSNQGSGGTPTGTVQFFDGAGLVGTGTLDGTGKATITFSGSGSLAVGSHSLTANYSGDSQFSSVTSTAVVHAVTKASSSSVVTTTVTSSLNPSVYGDTVTLSIQVSSSVGIQPTGSVTVVDGVTTLGTPALDLSGNATITVPAFTAGTHTIVVTYSGDSNYN